MNLKNKLFNAIQQYGFALDEIRIYLDTHPNCKNGLEYFQKYKKLQQEAVSEYNQKSLLSHPLPNIFVLLCPCFFLI